MTALPEGISLTAAAQEVLFAISADEPGDCSLRVWAALTGLTQEDAEAYAEEVASARPPITAHIAPF